MLRHFLIGSIEIRLIAASTIDAGPRIVRHDQLRGSVEVLESRDVAPDPVRQILAQGCLRESVSAGAQHGYEQRSRCDGAAVVIIDGDRGAGPIDEHLLARAMFLPHHDTVVAVPSLVQLAKAAVAVAFRLRFAIFLPQQLQGHVLVTL